MTLSKAVAVIAGLLVAAGGAGCGEGIGRDEALRGGSIVVAHEAPPESVDPALVRSRFATGLAIQAYLPVVAYRRVEGPEGSRLVPALSRRMPRPINGGRVYTFSFRKGLRFSNGELLRASDFERSLARALVLNPAARKLFADVVGAEDASVPAGIRGVTTDDRTGTVRIALTRRDRLFPYALASIWSAPLPSSAVVRDLSSRPPPGIGPYRVARVDREGDVVLVRRRGWKLDNVPAGQVEEISSTAIPDGAKRVRAGIDGRVDIVDGDAPVRLLPDLRSKYEGRYSERLTQEILYVAFDRTVPPFDAEPARRAVSFALDAAALDRIYDGFIAPSCNVLPPSVPGYREIDPCPYGPRDGNTDLIQASRLVEQAGAAGATVRIAHGEGSRGRALARYLALTVEKIGLRVRLLPRGAAERRQAWFASAAPALPHPASYLADLGDPVLRVRSSLLAQEKDAAAAEGHWAEVDRDIVSRAYVSPYGVRTVGVLASERVDTDLCLRYHPVYGVDYASVCLR